MKKIFLLFAAFGFVGVCVAGGVSSADVSAAVSLKTPGNNSVTYDLKAMQSNDAVTFSANKDLPLDINQTMTDMSNGMTKIVLTITGKEKCYFNFSEKVITGFRHDDCQFYMPGFWYRRNLRSPQEAPSFATSDSWVVREDRLSTPLTAAFDSKNGKYVSVMRLAPQAGSDALTTHKEGEVILSGRTTIGYTGFENVDGVSALAFGFPFREAPFSYVRKLTLAPSIAAFQKIDKGETLTATWIVKASNADSFSDVVRENWINSFDTYSPATVETGFDIPMMKDVMSNFFIDSYVGKYPLKYYSGVHLRTDDCEPSGNAEVGFVGRTLLNAFNAIEYAAQTGRTDIAEKANNILASYLSDGFTSNGFFRESVIFTQPTEDPNLSIRRQSEGVYAMLHYLHYEREAGRKHPEWDKKMRAILDVIVAMQNPDGSFPRKFLNDRLIVDPSGGSTPSATLPLVLGYKYFKDKRYLESAKKSAAYLEKELISKSDYFSSTLDANCEDKEAALYAATATYYLALVSKGEERKHYTELTREATYFALSWYYMWDVPFAEGQMLGDLGLKSRGWGNVSVENNHIDVFVFEFASILQWLAKEYEEPRFSSFAKVIDTSMRQLLPVEARLCGVAKVGFYPEVVQHTAWDYGKNGKGFYNDIFAPGWTVASLWELFTPQRAEKFLAK